MKKKMIMGCKKIDIGKNEIGPTCFSPEKNEVRVRDVGFEGIFLGKFVKNENN